MIRLERDAQVLARIGFETFEQLDVHVGDPARGVEKTVTGGIFANRFEKLSDEPLHARVVDHAHTSPVKV